MEGRNRQAGRDSKEELMEGASIGMMGGVARCCRPRTL